MSEDAARGIGLGFGIAYPKEELALKLHSGLGATIVDHVGDVSVDSLTFRAGWTVPTRCSYLW